MTDPAYHNTHGTSEILGKCIAGGGMFASGHTGEKYQKLYANIFADYVALVIAEVKARGPIDLDAVHQKTMARHWERVAHAPSVRPERAERPSEYTTRVGRAERARLSADEAGRGQS